MTGHALRPAQEGAATIISLLKGQSNQLAGDKIACPTYSCIVNK
jgi:hypothetical protein